MRRNDESASQVTRLRRQRVPPATAAHQAETARTLLAGASLRAGATLQTAALPVGARPRTVVVGSEDDVAAGEDMVSESTLQDEATESGQVVGAGRVPLPAPCRHPGSGAGRETVSAEWRRDAGVRRAVQR